MFIYRRKVQYHETDKMGVVHHTNYIKWMEETRTAHLEAIGAPYAEMERRGIVSPVVELQVEYRHPCTYSDEITVEMEVTKYTGIQLEVSYVMKKASDGETVCVSRSRHCFLADGKPVSLKRSMPDFHDILKADYENSKSSV